MVLSLPNRSEALCQWSENETLQRKRTCPDEEEDEETCSSDLTDFLKYYDRSRSCSLSSGEKRRPDPEAATTAVVLLSAE